ncbi:phage tail sheath family protein [Embleya sp. NPDC059259]|uniref:phage tail sheath family protein n=1 Tax=unclassified Embleya TaxID=2699296 RepID=UPI0036D086A7
MSTPLAPGVHLREIPSGVRLITATGTSTPAFLGMASDGPNTPLLVRGWSEFARIYLSNDLARIEQQASSAATLRRECDEFVRVDDANDELDLEALQTIRALDTLLGQPPGLQSCDELDALCLWFDEHAYIPSALLDTLRAYKTELLFLHMDLPLLTGYLAEVVYGFFANGGAACYIVRLEQGSGAQPTLQGDELRRSGLAGLETVPDVQMVAAPDLWTLTRDPAIREDMIKAVVAHCHAMGNRLALTEPPPDIAPAAAVAFPETLRVDDTTDGFAACYYPWVRVPGVAGVERVVPPCGHIAGVWAATDARRGVFKAPANVGLRGVLGATEPISDDQQADLNPVGVNCLRVFPGRGLLVWGARTLSDTRDWRYVNVRRLVCFLEDSIVSSSRWVVFEPNDERLWASLRHAVSAFLTDQWRAGALAGRTPGEAFYVVCDDTNNTPDTVDRGHVYCDIGVAPVRPAEFVVFRVTQTTAAPTVT